MDYLIESKNYDEYMETLIESYNPSAASGVMCRNTISVGWDGQLYDCDFNQMLGMKLEQTDHIAKFDRDTLLQREIQLDQHCFGCTSGCGSTCGGSITPE